MTETSAVEPLEQLDSPHPPHPLFSQTAEAPRPAPARIQPRPSTFQAARGGRPPGWDFVACKVHWWGGADAGGRVRVAPHAGVRQGQAWLGRRRLHTASIARQAPPDTAVRAGGRCRRCDRLLGHVREHAACRGPAPRSRGARAAQPSAAQPSAAEAALWSSPAAACERARMPDGLQVGAWHWHEPRRLGWTTGLALMAPGPAGLNARPRSAAAARRQGCLTAPCAPLGCPRPRGRLQI